MFDSHDFIRDNSYAQGIGYVTSREPQIEGPGLPAGTTVVSADNHIVLFEDIWAGGFPAHLEASRPMVWRDEKSGLYLLGTNRKSYIPEGAFRMFQSMEGRPSTADLNARMSDMDAEGIAAEIAYPQALGVCFSGFFDLEVREWTFRIYNEYLASVQARYPERIFPVGIANYWDPAKSAESIEHIARLGLKTFMVPTQPGQRADGSPIYYGAPEMDGFWSAVEDSGLPLSIHIGEGFHSARGGPAALAIQICDDLGAGRGAFRRLLAEFIFAGVFDRHPRLKIVFAEGQINWIPGVLQDAENLYDTYAGLLDYTPKRRPSEYWHTHCYSTFINDRSSLRLLDVIGADRALWSCDYPHNEGTFGYSRTSMNAVVETASAEDARKILGGNAISVYNLR